MNGPEENKDTLAALRELPAEVDLEQVHRMVATFPLAMGAMAWLIHTLKFNLNSILMTSIGTILIGTSAYLLTSSAPATSSPIKHAVVIEAPVAHALPDPAVVFDMPASKDPGPAPKATLPPAAPAIADPGPAMEPLSAPTPPAPVHGPMPQPIPAKAPIAPERSFDLRGFTGVAVLSSVDVIIEQGDFAVTASGDQGLVDGLELKTEGNMLKVAFQPKRGSFSHDDPLVLRVRMPALHELLVMGSGSINAGRFTRTDVLRVNITGSGNIILAGMEEAGGIEVLVKGSGSVKLQDVHVKGTANIKLTGSGDVLASGSTGRVDMLVTGSGSLNTADLRSSNGGRVAVTGSGNALVHDDAAVEMLTTGSGNIQTTGSGGRKGSRGVGDGGR